MHVVVIISNATRDSLCKHTQPSTAHSLKTKRKWSTHVDVFADLRIVLQDVVDPDDDLVDSGALTHDQGHLHSRHGALPCGNRQPC